MVVALWDIIFTCIFKLIDFFPDNDLLFKDNSIFDDLIVCIGYLNSFIGIDIFLVAVAHALTFFVADCAWSIIEWCYKKIPGVD